MKITLEITCDDDHQLRRFLQAGCYAACPSNINDRDRANAALAHAQQTGRAALLLGQVPTPASAVPIMGGAKPRTCGCVGDQHVGFCSQRPEPSHQELIAAGCI